jgi:hypothetical protein
MSEYRKKPIVIDAFKWTGAPDQTEDPYWIVEAIKAGIVTCKEDLVGAPLMCISTLEGMMYARVGEYIIQGIKGEIYPCKADIFEASYEAVEDEWRKFSGSPGHGKTFHPVHIAKQNFLDAYDDAKVGHHCGRLVLATKLPSGATEIMINTEDIPGKVKYIDDTYGDDMAMRNNPMIKIIDYMFV